MIYNNIYSIGVLIHAQSNSRQWCCTCVLQKCSRTW